MTTEPPGAATVGDLMTPDPFAVWPDTPLAEVADLLDRHDISGVPVVDWTGWVTGVVSRIDLLRIRESTERWANWPELEARHVMTSPPLTIDVSATLEAAVRMLDEHGVHRLVVVGADGLTPIGVLSETDVLRAMTMREDL